MRNNIEADFDRDLLEEFFEYIADEINKDDLLLDILKDKFIDKVDPEEYELEDFYERLNDVEFAVIGKEAWEKCKEKITYRD